MDCINILAKSKHIVKFFHHKSFGLDKCSGKSKGHPSQQKKDARVGTFSILRIIKDGR